MLKVIDKIFIDTHLCIHILVVWYLKTKVALSPIYIIPNSEPGIRLKLFHSCNHIHDYIISALKNHWQHVPTTLQSNSKIKALSYNPAAY